VECIFINCNQVFMHYALSFFNKTRNHSPAPKIPNALSPRRGQGHVLFPRFPHFRALNKRKRCETFINIYIYRQNRCVITREGKTQASPATSTFEACVRLTCTRCADELSSTLASTRTLAVCCVEMQAGQGCEPASRIRVAGLTRKHAPHAQRSRRCSECGFAGSPLAG